ncbi:MAG: hypothetical protein K6G04_07050 [Lachnospiraceae bacterium]|nr:hypothetical protein [Lachnospiraceae bacterium]
MGLSVSSLRPIRALSYSQVTPKAYAVGNESEVSDVFQSSVALQSDDRVNATPPVQYATAKKSRISSTSRRPELEENQRMNQAFNKYLAAFAGKTTSYGVEGMGESVSFVGNQIDMYA